MATAMNVACPTCGIQCQVQMQIGVSSMVVKCPSCSNDFQADAPVPKAQATPVPTAQATPVRAAAAPAPLMQNPPVQMMPVQASPVQAAPAPSATTQVDVRLTGSSFDAGGKREYVFVLLVGTDRVHQFAGRFSTLRKSCKAIFGEFPSRHAFQDFTMNEANVARRGEEMRNCFQQQLNKHDEGRALTLPQLHAALSMTQDAIQAFLRVAAARKAVADGARAQAAAQQAAIQQQQLADCMHAQEFNQLVAYANIAPGQLTTITYPRQQRFELRNKWWGWGDANIRGPGGHPWFMMQRTNASMFGEMFKNCQFSICNMRGEPLMMLQERFRWASYEYDLFRIDPRTGQPIPVCKIVREWGANFMRMTDQYQIQLYPAAAAHGVVQCSGRWPNQFTLMLNGAPVATVDKEFFAFTDKYHVTFAANIDVLLFIGIACGIDRIHHEVEDARK